MSEMAVPTTPYKGLMPYSEEDALFFFGREMEKEIITANLMASRMTLLYGATGVGKSSVLRAGVANHLRQETRQNLAQHGTPEFVLVVFSSWRDDPVVGLTERVQDSVARVLDGAMLDPVSPFRGLAQTLRAWTERIGGDLLVILDQFEEYFLYHPHEDGERTFAVEFPRAVNQQDLRVSFLISIREDSLAKLDRFKGRIPNLFDNYLRIEHLDREAARAAIEKPIEQYNRMLAGGERHVTIEPALVEAVLEQVLTGRVILGAGRGIVGTDTEPTPVDARIETPYLQLVMTRLWDEEIRAGSRTLRLETLSRLGGAERIVRTHLDGVMAALHPKEQDGAARIFHYLVTPSGTKIAHSVPDLAAYAGLPEPQIAQMLEKLSGGGRILRPIAPRRGQPAALRYEIFHDVLAPAILDWRTRYLRGQRRSLLKMWVISFFLTLVFMSFPVGVIAIIVGLRRTRPPFLWKQIFKVAGGWLMGWVVGLFGVGLIAYAITSAIGVHEIIEDTIIGILAIIGGSIGGLAGGVIVFRRFRSEDIAA